MDGVWSFCRYKSSAELTIGKDVLEHYGLGGAEEDQTVDIGA